MTTLTIASVQYGLGSRNGLTGIESAEHYWDGLASTIKEAAAQGANLVVFPEYVTAHLLAFTPAMSNEEACEYLDSFTAVYEKFFLEQSRETHMIIVGGTHICKEHDDYVNKAHMFFPDGRVETQNKFHLTPEEKQRWKLRGGNALNMIDTEWGKVAILTCYDIEFPEIARIAAKKGAELILCPSYTDTAAGYHRVRNCCQARAIENQFFVQLSGIVGSMSEPRPQIDEGHCQAGVFSSCDFPFPSDGILGVGTVNENMIVYTTIDFAQLRQNREHGIVAPFYDRRQDLYDREELDL
ncbi:carbon-nitrogen hydrolase family protein [Paenibacillus agricola]|uniref:Carbon-nitrogen hydrolase family protein n=1 Tax=Paenibacillus agricola TaxID=2716264 RepID=A0ABX0IZV7_9BACL|nr:carbon-nitrogen hydrolase family protein [Paenibacillus agricola]NHN28968.1 carbon-nitrogen hydrolase family protein [Paenibacillus agricola]